MARKSGSWVATGLVALGLASALFAWRIRPRPPRSGDSSASDAAAVAAALERLPGDSFAVATIPDLVAYAERFDGTALGRLVSDPELVAATTALFAVPGGGDAHTALGGLLESLAELKGLGLRSLAIALFPLPDGAPSRTGFAAVAAAQDPERVLAWIDRRIAAAAATAGGVPPATPEEGRAGTIAYRCLDDLCRAANGDLVYFASSRAALERALARVAGQQDSLVDQPRIRDAIAGSQAKRSGFFACADLQRLASLLVEVLGSDAEASKLLRLLRVEALQSLAVSEAADGELFHLRVRVAWDPASTGLLPVLLTLPERTLVLDRALPADADSAWFGSLPDLAQAWDIGLGELRAGTAPAEQAGIDQAIAALNGQLGFDLRNDLVGAFGGEWGIAWSAREGARPVPGAPATHAAGLPALNRRRLLVLSGVRDALRAERLVSALAEALRASNVAVSVAALGSGKQWTAAVGDDPALHPTLALFDDRIVIATRGDDLSRLLADSGRVLAADTTYQTMRARLGGTAALVAWQRSGGSFKETLMGVTASGGDPASVPPPELVALGARVDRALSRLPPALAIGRGQAGLLEYEALAPFNLGVATSLVLALGAPQLQEAAAARKVQVSVGALRTIAFAVEAYAVDSGAPPNAATIAELKGLIEPTWVGELPVTDAWGHALIFRGDPLGYVVASPGADGRFEADWAELCRNSCADQLAATTNLEQDLLYSAGRLLRAPQGLLEP